MKITPTTKIALVSIITVAFIGIALFSLPNSTSVEGTALSPSGKTFTKVFMYEYLNQYEEAWQCKDWYISGLEVDVTFLGCETYLGRFTTDRCGRFTLTGVPSGNYYFNWTWCGVEGNSTHYLCCNTDHAYFYNYMQPKGGDRAISFSSTLCGASLNLFL